MTPFRLSAGDLVVRKFYYPEVFTFSGAARAGEHGMQLRFDAPGGDSVWEYSSALRQPRLYTVLRLPNSDRVRRRAQKLKQIACARLGRFRCT